MRCKDVEYLLAIVHAAALDPMSEHDFLAGIVQARIESESVAVLPWIVDRPSRESARDLGDVLLRVSAIHAECVQLHQLAAVVLVQAALSPRLLLRRCPR